MCTFPLRTAPRRTAWSHHYNFNNNNNKTWFLAGWSCFILNCIYSTNILLQRQVSTAWVVPKKKKQQSCCCCSAYYGVDGRREIAMAILVPFFYFILHLAILLTVTESAAASIQNLVRSLHFTSKSTSQPANIYTYSKRVTFRFVFCFFFVAVHV